MTPAEVLMDARNFVYKWVQDKDIIGNEQATLRLDYLRELRAYNLFLKLKKDSTKEGEVIKVRFIKPLNKNELDDAFEEYLRNLPITRRSQVAEVIRYDLNSDQNMLKRWILAVTGSCEEVNLKVMLHWMWLVKRNLNGLPVVYHIMPIIASPQKAGAKKQGGGKSTAILRLIEPIKTVSTTLRMDQVSDDRSFTAFNTYMVGFLDEMAGAGKVEIEDFKRIVTAETLTYRPMRTNIQIQIKNLCSFIGASNNSLSDIIKDTTGLRRFFQINSLEMLNHDEINSIDYISMWKSVDENLVRGYIEEVLPEISKEQDKIVSKDELEVFMEDNNLYPTEEVEETTVKKLYDAYVIHSQNYGNKYPVKYQNFYKKLENLGLSVEERRDEKRARYKVIKVNAQNSIRSSL